MWPLKSHISSLSLKYHIVIAVCHLRLIKGHFAICFLLLQKHKFWIIISGLKLSLRLEKLYCGHSDSHCPMTMAGYFHKENNDLKLTNSLELAHLPKSAESHLNVSVNFISGHSFKKCTNSESLKFFPFHRGIRLISSFYSSKNSNLQISSNLSI